jgi:hypothetical protein
MKVRCDHAGKPRCWAPCGHAVEHDVTQWCHVKDTPACWAYDRKRRYACVRCIPVKEKKR